MNSIISCILLVGWSLSVVSLATGAIQCPANPATRNADGSVTYSPLPSGSSPTNASYNPGAIGGWYSLASGFVDAVRPGSLPFGRCKERRWVISSFFVICFHTVITRCQNQTSC